MVKSRNILCCCIFLQVLRISVYICTYIYGEKTLIMPGHLKIKKTLISKKSNIKIFENEVVFCVFISSPENTNCVS